MAISSYYLLGGRIPGVRQALDHRRLGFRAGVGVVVVVLGDESGYTVSENQKMKLAAIEGMWETEPAPAGFDLVRHSRCCTAHACRLRDQDTLGARHHRYALVRSADPGIDDLVARAQQRIRNGMIAYDALRTSARPNRDDARRAAQLREHAADLGYALLLKRYR